MGLKVSVACVWTCVSRPPSRIQPLLVCPRVTTIDRFHCISQIWFTLLSPCNFPYRRSQSSDQSFSTNVSRPSPPPQLPDHKKAPAIKVQISTFSSDRAKTINNPSHSDMVLRLEGKTYHAHRYVLASASDLFRQLLGVTQEVKVRFVYLVPAYLGKCCGYHTSMMVTLGQTNSGCNKEVAC